MNILSAVALAYQPIWGPDRGLLGVRLRVRSDGSGAVDAGHVLSVLDAQWTDNAPRLFVSFAERGLLNQALVHTPFEHITLELPDPATHAGADVVSKVATARRMGHRFLVAGQLAQTRSAPVGQVSPAALLQVGPDLETLVLRVLEARAEGRSAGLNSPVLPGHIYEQPTHVAVAAHCLDDQAATGVAGWPVADTLKGHRHFGVRPDRHTIIRLQQALMHDKAMDRVESLVYQDPVLTFRLLRLVNSPLFGPTREVHTIRQALMLLGQKPVRNWLMDQLPGAATDKDLVPVRMGMVLRARFMEHLMDPGPQHELRADIYTAGLFSQLDQLTHEPLAKTLARLPLSDAVVAALLRQSGPYHPYLDIACHLEGLDAVDTVAAVCEAHSFPIEGVNRALLRMLSGWST